MQNVTCKVLGIHSSPFERGNTAYFLQYALDEASKIKGVQAESIAIAKMSISDCCHCNWCIKHQTIDKVCVIDDDAVPILKKILDCDLLVLASPAYFMRLSGIMACLIDRTRCFVHGRQKRLALKDKIGVALTVAWCRNTGIETTLRSMFDAFLVHGMRTVSYSPAGVVYGVGAVTAQRNKDFFYKKNKLGVKKDQEALRSVSLLIRKAVKEAKILKL